MYRDYYITTRKKMQLLFNIYFIKLILEVQSK